MKKTLVWMGVLLLAPLFVFAGGEKEAAAPAEGPVQAAATGTDLSGEMAISVESWMVDKYNMKEVIARFEQAHPQAKVKLLTHEGLGANYLTMFLEWAQTRRSTADLYFGGLVSQIAPAVIDDLLIPWDEVMTGELARNKWIAAFLDPSFVPGPAGTNFPYLPGLGETMNFQINVTYMKMIGKVDSSGRPTMPETYQEIADYAGLLAGLKVEGKTITGLEMEYGINFAPDTWMAAVIAGEGTYLTRDGRINWDSPAGKDWIRFQKSIVDRGAGGTLTFTDNNGARNGLKAGQIAAINASNSRSTEANAVLGKDVVQMFPYPGQGGTMAFCHQVYIPRVAARVDLARAFAREALFSEFAQTWSAVNFGKMPTLWKNYDALDNDDPNFVEVRKEITGPSMGQWTFRDGQSLRKAYVDELQAYMTGRQSLDEMIKRLKDFQAKADLTVPGK